MRFGNLVQFFSRFRERYVKYALIPPRTLQQKLQRQCCFSGSRITLYDVKTMAGESAREYAIQPCNTGSGPFRLARYFGLRH
jgi:hypothetical protein